jgi:hypothetical protein
MRLIGQPLASFLRKAYQLGQWMSIPGRAEENVDIIYLSPRKNLLDYSQVFLLTYCIITRIIHV